MIRYVSVVALVLLFLSPNLAAAPLGAVVQTSHFAQKPMGMVVVTTDYNSATKVTTLHFVNTSQKEVTAINFTLEIPMADGTISTANEMGTDWLRSGAGTGILPGGHYDFDLPPRDEGRIDATVDVVIYSDNTAEVRNQRAFQAIVAARKAEVVAKQKINEFINDALANVPRGQRGAIVLDKLNALQKSGRDAGMAGAIQNMTNISRLVQKTGDTEEEAAALRNIVKLNTNEIELLTRYSEDPKQVQQ